MKEFEQINDMLSLLKLIKTSVNKREKLSNKAFEMNTKTHTNKQISKIITNLDWECMNIDKLKTDFARKFKNSVLDVSTEEKTYKPTGFHEYKH